MWKTCRNQEKKIFNNFKEIKEKYDKKKDIIKKYSNPLQNIKVIGNAIKIEYQILNNTGNMIPLQGNSNKLVDCYDARNLIGSLSLYEKSNKTLDITENDTENVLNYYRYNCIIESMKKNISEEECIDRVRMNIENNILFNPIKHHKDILNEKSSNVETNNGIESDLYGPNIINSFGEQYLIRNYNCICNDISKPKKIEENNNYSNKLCLVEVKKIENPLLQLNILLDKTEEIEDNNVDISKLSPMELIKYKTRMKLSQVSITKDTNILNVNKSSSNSNHPFKYNIMDTSSENNSKKSLNNKNNKQLESGKPNPGNVNKTSRKRNRELNKSKLIPIDDNKNENNEQVNMTLEYHKTNTATPSYSYNIYDKRYKFTAY